MESPPSLRILVVEDDPRMAEFLRVGLSEKGHAVETARSAEEGRLLLEEHLFHAVVLDIGLPGKSGYSIVEYLGGRPGRPAIVMLTALNQEHHVVYGLDAGADDYLTKPFSFSELAARIVSAARRARTAAADNLAFGPFELDLVQRRLFSNRAEIHLSPSEYLLLRALALDRGEVVPRRKLMQAIWGAAPVSHGALDTLVNTLREKLNPQCPGMISTIRARGYTLLEEEELRERSAP